MRNIAVIQDSIVALDGGHEDSETKIVSLAVNHTNHRLYTLSENGTLGVYDVADSMHHLSSTKLLFEDTPESWFSVEFLVVASSVVALSKEGSIVTADDIGEDELLNIDQIGVIDGGIFAAAWSPDYSSLAIVTGNNTFLLMSSTWEPICEIDFPAFAKTSPVSISWKGDGELLSVVSRDTSDNICYARTYSNMLQLQAVGRNVAEGPAATLKGVGGQISFAPNGTLIAIHQQKAELQQISFLEKNGLRHGDFDLRMPPKPHGPIIGDWQVSHISWDLTSTVLAVGWSAAVKESAADRTWGCVQLYYRENFYWYLKQQWSGSYLTFLTFDTEVAGRLYLSQTSIINDGKRYPSLRIIDTFWKISSCGLRDGTVSVTDGETQHFTALGYHNVPPPMSMFQEKLPSWGPEFAGQCSRSLAFWPLKQHVTTLAWGLVSLINDQGLLAFTFGDARGRLTRGPHIAVHGHLPYDGQNIFYREVVALSSSDSSSVIILLVGSRVRLVNGSSSPSSVSTDIIRVVQLDLTSLLPQPNASQEASWLKSTYTVDEIPGSIYAVTCIHDDAGAVAIGMKDSESGSFEVYRWLVSASFDAIDAQTVQWQAQDVENLMAIPEVCPQLTVLANHAQQSQLSGGGVSESKERIGTEDTVEADNDSYKDQSNAPNASYYTHTVLSLSLRNRLYCGEVLLVPGASSFVFNHAYHMLMFVTVGTKPLLHFVTMSTLLQISPLMGEDQQLYEAAEPRPVERGARLVASIEEDSKIIIQLPRGNLETFEPRPLIILRAQQLLNAGQLVDCLVLLRLQRIDLNYLVDFDPSIFFNRLSQFVPAALAQKADLLSLFLTSLEAVDVTTTKFVLFDETSRANRVRRQQLIAEQGFVGDSKVNLVCLRVRETLLQWQQQQEAASPSTSSAQKVAAVHALLCTFAKQRPPLLVDALRFIKSTCKVTGPAATVSVSLQAAIKYLVFLVDGAVLFDAALGDCEFDMARAVARQCQMDPKSYLPLLERFESVGRGYPVDSLPNLLMHGQVHFHLQRASPGVACFVRLLQDYYVAEKDFREEGASIAAPLLISETQLRELQRSAEESIGRDASLFAEAVPQLANLEVLMADDLMSANEVTLVAVEIARAFISQVRLRYATHALQQLQHTEAIQAFLTTYPPSSQRAIDAAMALGDWTQAVMLAGRFHLDPSIPSSSTITPTKLVQDIVSNFRQNQELVSFSTTLEASLGSMNQFSSSIGDAGHHDSAGSQRNTSESKAMQAARLCVDYLQDVESAVSILCNAHHWQAAVEVAARFSRRDLLQEIYVAAREAAADLIQTLDERKRDIPSAILALQELWKDEATAEARLELVATTDPLLQRTLQHLLDGNYDPNHTNQNDDPDNPNKDIPDTASDFSAASKFSLLSLRSHTRSTSSGISVLSQLSTASRASSVAGSESSSATASAFSIEGLEHTLLSRGKIDPDAPPPTTGAKKPSKRAQRQKKAAMDAEELKREQQQSYDLVSVDGTITALGSTRRRQRRNEKARVKAQEKNKDECGLKREAEQCGVLWTAASSLSQLVAAVVELCQLLAMNHGAVFDDHLLSIQVQESMQGYVDALQQAQSLPPAPRYPISWLKVRDMAQVAHFQDARLLLQQQVRRTVQSATASALPTLEVVRLDDAHTLAQRYPRDFWHVRADGVQRWSQARLLLLQQPVGK